MQTLQTKCSRPCCNNEAVLQVTYKPINNAPEEVRRLCKSCYSLKDEYGIKYYQEGKKSVRLIR